MGLLDMAILGMAGLSGTAMLWPRLRRKRLWRAMVTPLASIIGSGFLILGPLLAAAYGWLAPLVMAGLCLAAWAFGAAIRANIAARAARPVPAPLVARLDRASELVLGFAYVISVAYYLNLFGAFGTRLIWPDNPEAARGLTSAVFVLILAVGWRRGFGSLERLEYLAVTLKLAIIAGLLLGLGVHFQARMAADGPLFPPAAERGWPALTLAFGLLVTVQGFETSRYLGAAYCAAERIRSMRWAQALAALIYLSYTTMLTFGLASPARPIAETAIIDLMERVAPVLPGLLVGAALAAQLSAAIADTAGAGGLSEELTRRRLPARQAYLGLVLSGLVLTWSANVFEIIAWASRAFAAYYALQSAIAMLEARAGARHARALGFGALTVLALVIVVFSSPAEGG